MKKLLLLVCLIPLAACVGPDLQNPVPKTTADVSQDFSDDTKSTRAKIADFIFPEVNHEQVVNPPPKVVQQPFCYKTWDKPVCYSSPEPMSQQDRLVGNNNPI